MVSFGGAWQSEEEDEETLWPTQNLGQVAAKQSWAGGRVTERRWKTVLIPGDGNQFSFYWPFPWEVLR